MARHRPAHSASAGKGPPNRIGARPPPSASRGRFEKPTSYRLGAKAIGTNKACLFSGAKNQAKAFGPDKAHLSDLKLWSLWAYSKHYPVNPVACPASRQAWIWSQPLDMLRYFAAKESAGGPLTTRQLSSVQLNQPVSYRSCSTAE